MSYKGYFIDWNGQARCTSDPGHGYCCEVDAIARSVTVINKRGMTIHEAKLYRSLEAIAQTGIRTDFVSGSYPFTGHEISVSHTRVPKTTHTDPQRAPLWFHQLREKCTSHARHVYTLLLNSGES